MRIRHFSFMGVRRLDGLKKDLPRSSDTDLVVVHGGRARGKTTFLDTLAVAKEKIAEYGSADSRWDGVVASSAGAAKVAIDWEASESERSRMGLSDALLSSESILGSARSPADAPIGLRGLLSDPGDATRGSVHYLHDSRQLDGPLSFGADDAAFRQRLTTRNSKFGDLYDLLDQGEKAEARARASARFAELCPGHEIVGLKRFGTSFYPMVKDPSGAVRTADKFSASERQAFLLALYTSRTPIVDSLVLVDAPEIGFGDLGAVDYVRALLRWTLNTQLVVATASDAVRTMPEVAHVVELPA
jgi:hypothetical protein